ncbi:hypothetical protein ACFU44_07790 [Nocardia rhizosphaerihabitans]|uniref:hypothetical protein n=1 Tax=Nocardia rhizosphaerihabitans TaxID=1691570 RepID=UPI0036706F8F
MSGTDPTYIGAMEHFESMPHEQIYARTQQIDAAAVLSASMDWLESAAALTTTMPLTRSNAERVIEETGWEGAAADAAFASTRSFAAALDELAEVFGEVGARLGGVAAAAEAVKLAVVAPGGSGPIGTIARLLEAAHVIDAQMAAEALRQEAVLAMNMIYKPAYSLAGTGVPALPAPPGAAQGSPAGQGGSRNGSTPEGAVEPGAQQGESAQGGTSPGVTAPGTQTPSGESPAPSQSPAPPTTEQPAPAPTTPEQPPSPPTGQPAPQTPAPASEQPAPQPEPSAPQPAPTSEQPVPSAPQPPPRAPEPAPQAPAPTSEQPAPEPSAPQPAPRAPEPHAAEPAPPVPGGPVDPGGQPGVTGPIPDTNIPGPQPNTPPPAPPLDLDQPGVIPPRR